MTMASRVVLIVENLAVPRDRRVWNEATTLRDAGYHVSVICPVGPGFTAPYEVLDDIEIHRHPLPPDTGSRLGFIREYLNALRWERRLLRRIGHDGPVDVIHLANPPDVLYLVARPYRRRGARVIFDHHDVAPELYESKFGRRGPLYWLLRFFERRTFRNSDLVISTNESIRDVAIRRGRRRPEDVRVVRNGPDPDVFAPRAQDAEVRQRAGLREGSGTLVVWVGHMGDQAGLDDLVDAAAHIVHGLGRNDIRFMIIGDGPVRAATEARAERKGVAEHVRFTGPIYGDDLVRHLASCDIGLLTLPKTPLGDRSTPTKTMEYMALGLPVVQYDLVESRRTAEDAALYARPNDPLDMAEKVVRLADAPDERERLGLRGRQRVVERLAWRHQAPELLRAYRDLLNGATE